MGIQDRDYYRDGSRGLFDSWGRLGVTGWIIVVTSVVFFVQCVTGHPLRSPLVKDGAYDPVLVEQGEVWRLITPLFLHVSLWHLVLNMLAVYFAGTQVEAIYRPREFLLFYLVGGVFAQTFYFVLQVTGLVDPGVRSVGASGAVMAVLLLYVFHFPHARVLFNFLIPMPAWVFVLVYVGLDIAGTAGFGNRGVAHWVHLGGALFGTLYYQTGMRFAGLFTRSPRPAERRARPQLRVLAPPPREEDPSGAGGRSGPGEPVGAAVESAPRPKEAVDEHLEAKVDQVLEKVSKHGQESLTPEEREILFKASELYKKRRK